MQRNITIIAACDHNGCIGKNRQVPWRLAEDMKIFRELTTGYPVIMGRKTYESLPPTFRPLPGRQNIVITRRDNLDYGDQVTIVQSLEQALVSTGAAKHIFVIGGADIFRLALPEAKRIILTSVQTTIESGDIFMPELISLALPWHKVASVSHPQDKNNEYDFNLEVWHRQDYPMAETFYLNSSRYVDQLIRMLTIMSEGICSFCPEHITRFHTGEIVRQTNHWQVVVNGWPYEGAKVHWLIIPKEHLTDLTQISPEAWLELGPIINNLVQAHSLAGYALFCRSGDMRKTSATVAHLHFHLLSGQGKDGDGKPIKVKLGFDKL